MKNKNLEMLLKIYETNLKNARADLASQADYEASRVRRLVEQLYEQKEKTETPEDDARASDRFMFNLHFGIRGTIEEREKLQQKIQFLEAVVQDLKDALEVDLGALHASMKANMKG